MIAFNGRFGTALLLCAVCVLVYIIYMKLYYLFAKLFHMVKDMVSGGTTVPAAMSETGMLGKLQEWAHLSFEEVRAVGVPTPVIDLGALLCIIAIILSAGGLLLFSADPHPPSISMTPTFNFPHPSGSHP